MLSLMILSVVLGLATAAPQGFHLENPAVAAARNDFIREYNRLAALAAAAPDINIIMANRRIDNPAHNVVNTNNFRSQPAPVRTAAAPAFNKFAFSANLGGNQQFVPQANTFPAIPTHHNLGGHLAGHHVAAPHHLTAAGPVQRWTGPFADTVPAGVHGLPMQVRDTPAVAAAKASHYAALNAVYQRQQTHF